MAIYILGPDQDGNCCTCEERVNVCDTCSSFGCSILFPLDGFGVNDPYPDLADAEIAQANLLKLCKLFANVNLSEISIIDSFTASEVSGGVSFAISASSAGPTTNIQVVTAFGSSEPVDIDIAGTVGVATYVLLFQFTGGVFGTLHYGSEGTGLPAWPGSVTIPDTVGTTLLRMTFTGETSISVDLTISSSDPEFEFCSGAITYMDGLDIETLPCP